MVNKVMNQLKSFMKVRVILSAAELDLFTKIDKEPTTAVYLAKINNFNLKGLVRLLDYLVVLDLLKKENDSYYITEKGSWFSSLHKETVLPVVLMFNYLWDKWNLLTDIVSPLNNKNTILAKEIMVDAMHSISNNISKEIANYFNTNSFNKLLDIGGASGTYTIEFLNKNPNLKAIIYDIKEVIQLTKKRINFNNLSQRVELIEGDFNTDKLPNGCDLILLFAVIHSLSPEQNLNLYKKISNILLPNGSLLIKDYIMDESRTYPPYGTLFSINMLTNTEGGNTYTFFEVKDMLLKAGFNNIKIIKPSEDIHCIVEAKLN